MLENVTTAAVIQTGSYMGPEGSCALFTSEQIASWRQNLKDYGTLVESRNAGVTLHPRIAGVLGIPET